MKISDEYPYPESDKLVKIQKFSQKIGEFMEWLEGQGIHLAKYDESGHHLWPEPLNIQNRLADFFDIDLEKLEAEKRHMLDELRRLNELEEEEASDA